MTRSKVTSQARIKPKTPPSAPRWGLFRQKPGLRHTRRRRRGSQPGTRTKARRKPALKGGRASADALRLTPRGPRSAAGLLRRQARRRFRSAVRAKQLRKSVLADRMAYETAHTSPEDWRNHMAVYGYGSITSLSKGSLDLKVLKRRLLRGDIQYTLQKRTGLRPIVHLHIRITAGGITFSVEEHAKRLSLTDEDLQIIGSSLVRKIRKASTKMSGSRWKTTLLGTD